MKKFLHILVIVLLIGSCSCSTEKPTSVVYLSDTNISGITNVAGIKINLPKIDGFLPIKIESKKFSIMSSATLGGGNWLLFMYATEEDAKKLNSGDVFATSSNIQVMISKDSLNKRISKSDWKDECQENIKTLKNVLKSIDFNKFNEQIINQAKKQLKKDHHYAPSDKIDMSIDETKLLGEPIFSNGILSFTLIQNLNSRLSLQKVNLIVVKKKLLFVYFIKLLEGENTINELDDISNEFLSKLKAINI